VKKHNKMTAPERDQIAWWLAGGVTIREMEGGLAEAHARYWATRHPRSFYSSYYKKCSD
jgi:hypothetical protein